MRLRCGGRRRGPRLRSCTAPARVGSSRRRVFRGPNAGFSFGSSRSGPGDASGARATASSSPGAVEMVSGVPLRSGVDMPGLPSERLKQYHPRARRRTAPPTEYAVPVSWIPIPHQTLQRKLRPTGAPDPLRASRPPSPDSFASVSANCNRPRANSRRGSPCGGARPHGSCRRPTAAASTRAIRRRAHGAPRRPVATYASPTASPRRVPRRSVGRARSSRAPTTRAGRSRA